MKEKVIELVGDKLDSLGVSVFDIYLEKEGSTNYLRVALDSEDILDVEKVTDATKILDPIIEKADLVDGEYILDIYAKPKGDD